MYSRTLKSTCLALALACTALVPSALSAQDSAKTAKKAAPTDYASRWDIFAGYSYLSPKGTVQVPQPNGTVQPFSYNAVNVGGLFSGAYYFNKYVGAQVEYGLHEWGGPKSNTNIGEHGNNDGFQTFGAGLIFRYPTGDITPFVHALVNADRIGGPDHNPYTWGPGVTAGGGLDYETPLFNHRLAIRLFQADYEYMHADFGPNNVYGGRANINAARLSTGVVFHVGSIAPPAPPTIACSANPASVFAGEKVAITSTANGLNPKEHSVYTWAGDGVSGSEATTTIDTTNQAPGTYTVKCGVKEGKPGKEGLKPWQSADASTTYTVKEFEPPTVSCAANPSTIKPGDTATITSTGVSPQNRPLTYSYTANAGSVSGTGTTATYNSTGAPTGAVDITCKVSDDKGHSATSNTSVTIVKPEVPQPHTQALCSISFEKDKARPTRVDNEAKACLDEVALDLQKQADAKAVLVGQSDAKEKAKVAKEEKIAAKHKKAKVEDPAAQRAVNAKAYLVDEKGIDASRVSVATSAEDGKKVEDYLVPAGADFASDVKSTTPANLDQTKVEKRKPLGVKKHHKK